MRSFSLLVCVLATACAAPRPLAVPASPASAAPAPVTASESSTSSARFPITLTTTPGTGAALFSAASSAGAPIGYVSSEVAVDVLGPPEGDRVPVRIRGGMDVRAYLALSRLGAYVTHRGRIRGTPVYVAANDLVHVVAFEDDGRARVEVTPAANGAAIGQTYVGTFPLSGLGGSRIAAGDDTAAPGTSARLPARQAVTLFDAPNGNAVATVAPADIGVPCLVARDEGGFRAVLVGTGPYLAGYVDVPTTPAAMSLAAVLTRARVEGVPRRLREDASAPLVRLPAGTRVTYDGRTVAELLVPGYAREMQRHEDLQEVDVYVAVDDDIALRGIVPLASVSAVPRSSP